jgi:uncharacterized protein YlxW (UPF0749 family)
VVYKAQKFVRRNKFLVSALPAVAIALATAILLSTWQAIRATRMRQWAEAGERAAQTAQAEESKLREQAQVQELAARQSNYASDINQAYWWWMMMICVS